MRKRPALDRRRGTFIWNEDMSHGPFTFAVEWKKKWCRLFLFASFYVQVFGSYYGFEWHRTWK